MKTRVEKEKEYYKIRMAKFPDVYREYARLIRLAFPNHACEASRKFRNANPEYWSAWKRRHSELFTFHEAKRRARRQKATIGNVEAIKKIYARAKELRKRFDVAVDHIIPLAKGGAHSAENLQIIFSKENSQKGVSLNHKPKVVF